jgi:hypothetical protein
MGANQIAPHPSQAIMTRTTHGTRIDLRDVPVRHRQALMSDTHRLLEPGQTPFEQLLAAAAAEPETQVLLFVFAGAELPADATPAQRASFQQGTGGELAPLMCVEKTLDELSTFDALVAESRSVGPDWQVVFAAGLPGRDGRPPDGRSVDAALRTMVERIKHGAVGGMLALSSSGEALALT